MAIKIFKLSDTQLKAMVQLPEHDCNPSVKPPLEEGQLRVMRAPLFNECPRCYKELTYSEEQLKNKLALEEMVINFITNKEDIK